MIHMLHGALGSPSDWDDFIPLLQADGVHPVDLYDNEALGFGSFARALNAGSSQDDVLIGYSMGGRLALHAILDEGSKWSKAVIISAHTGMIDPAEKQLRIESDESWAKLLKSDWSRFVDQWSAQPVFGGREIPWNRSSEMAPGKNIQRCFTCWSLGRQKNLLQELEAVAIPVLWISGEEDAKFSAIASKAVQRIPDSRAAIIPGAGHRCPWDQPELTAGVIRGFLSS